MKLNSFLLAFLLGTSLAQAQNRQASDTIFNEPAKAGWTQILIGVVKLGVAEKLYPQLRAETNALHNAEQELVFAEDAAISEEHRARSIAAIRENPSNYAFDRIDPEDLNSLSAARIERLESAPVITAAEKASLIESAKLQVAEARKLTIDAARAEGILPKGVRVVRIIGSTLLVADVLGAVYVWNVLDANPTLSPGVTYVNGLIKRSH